MKSAASGFRSVFLLPSSCEKFNSVAELLFIADFEIVPREFVKLLALAQAMGILNTSPSINGRRLLFCKQKLEWNRPSGRTVANLKRGARKVNINSLIYIKNIVKSYLYYSNTDARRLFYFLVVSFTNKSLYNLLVILVWIISNIDDTFLNIYTLGVTALAVKRNWKFGRKQWAQKI